MVAVETFVTQAVNGLVLGSILALIAMGLAIIFGLMGIVNFAHGAFYAVGAYVGYTVLSGLGPEGYFVALLVVPVVVGVVGVGIEMSILRPLYGRDLLYSLILTFGLMLMMHEGIDIIWGRGGSGISYPVPQLLDFTVPLVIIEYPAYRLFVVLLAAVVALAVWLFLQRTDLGIIIRAATENRDMVKSLGINVQRVYTIVFAVGVGIAGLAGTAHAPMVSLYPEMGVNVIVQSFVVVVIGGLNNFRGSIVAGILVGEVSALTYLVSPALTDVVIFLLMAVVLLVRPQGLAGIASGGVE
jgi:branched-subunit amino acid ABC-type transport system permease component